MNELHLLYYLLDSMYLFLLYNQSILVFLLFHYLIYKEVYLFFYHIYLNRTSLALCFTSTETENGIRVEYPRLAATICLVGHS